MTFELALNLNYLFCSWRSEINYLLFGKCLCDFWYKDSVPHMVEVAGSTLIYTKKAPKLKPLWSIQYTLC